MCENASVESACLSYQSLLCNVQPKCPTPYLSAESEFFGKPLYKRVVDWIA